MSHLNAHLHCGHKFHHHIDLWQKFPPLKHSSVRSFLLTRPKNKKQQCQTSDRHLWILWLRPKWLIETLSFHSWQWFHTKLGRLIKLWSLFFFVCSDNDGVRIPSKYILIIISGIVLPLRDLFVEVNLYNQESDISLEWGINLKAFSCTRPKAFCIELRPPSWISSKNVSSTNVSIRQVILFKVALPFYQAYICIERLLPLNTLSTQVHLLAIGFILGIYVREGAWILNEMTRPEHTNWTPRHFWESGWMTV